MTDRKPLPVREKVERLVRAAVAGNSIYKSEDIMSAIDRYAQEYEKGNRRYRKAVRGWHLRGKQINDMDREELLDTVEHLGTELRDARIQLLRPGRKKDVIRDQLTRNPVQLPDEIRSVMERHFWKYE